jgi:DNA repair protein RadA
VPSQSAKHSPHLITGNRFIDEVIGGLPRRGITHIYGAAGVGKSTLAMEAYLGIAFQGYGSFVVDCGGAYNPRRLLQLCRTEELPAHRITLFKPRTFQEQCELIEKLHLFLDSTIRLIVIDPITSFYRRQITKDTSTAYYRELAENQLPRLIGLAQDNDITIIIVNQISTWNGENHPVGGDAIHRYAQLEIRIERLQTNTSVNRWVVLNHPRQKNHQRLLLAELRESGFHMVKGFDGMLPEIGHFALT